MTKALDRLPGVPKLPAKLQAKLEKSLLGWFEHLEPHSHRSYRRGLVHFAEWLASDEDVRLDLTDAPEVRSSERQRWEDEAVAAAGRYLLGQPPPMPNYVVQSYVADLREEGYARSTVVSRLAALRWAVREARRMGQINWHLEVDLPKPRKNKDGRIEENPGRDMTGPTKAEARRLLEAAKADADPRAWFLFSYLRYEGLREHEIRQLNYEDVDFKRLTASMVRKKRWGMKAYPVSPQTMEALRSWVKVRGGGQGPLLYGGQYGRNSKRRIGQTTIYSIVQRVGEAAGVSTSPHKIRHRACTDIVKMSMKKKLPEEEILFLTGHSSRQALAPYYEANKSYKDVREVLSALSTLDDEDDEDAENE